MKLAATNPAVPPDPIFVQSVLRPLGLLSGSWRSVGAPDRRALAAAYERVLTRLGGQGAVLSRARQRPLSGWSLPSQAPQGSFGSRYGARASVALLGLAQAVRPDALYFNARVDGFGTGLDGSRRYRMTFAPGSLPPVRAFWSITLYDNRGYLIPNRYGRYAVSSGAMLTRDPDGSIVIYLQPDPPDAKHRANWIPTPEDQGYQLSLRCYWPGAALLDGKWVPPRVVPQKGRPALRT